MLHAFFSHAVAFSLCLEAGKGTAPVPAVPFRCTSLNVLLQSGNALGGYFCRQRQEPVLDDDFLAFLGEDEFQELLLELGQGFPRRLGHIDVEEAAQGVLVAESVLIGCRIGLLPLFFRKGEDLDAGSPVADAGVADAVFVLRYPLDNGGRARLLLDDILEITLGKGVLLEKPVGA